MASGYKKLTLVDESNSGQAYSRPYKIVGIENTIEWHIGDRLDEKDISEILRRNGVSAVDVKIK